jgi:protein TonB
VRKTTDQQQHQSTPSELDAPIPITPQEAESLLVSKVAPQYPNLARQARIQGTVTLDAIIGKDGGVRSLNVASGHPMLVPAAMAAVRQWRYKPYDSDGLPSDVKTQITVNFVLSSGSQ